MSAVHIERLKEHFHKRERTIKLELAIVSVLWLVGCPIACLLFSRDDTLYAKPQEEFCGLYGLSISSSMTGMYPKILGSIMAPIFSFLIVQRTSGALCSNLKLGWLARFPTNVNDPTTAALLWKHIERIEYLGYFASGCLVALVALDSKDFPLSHMGLATFAFFLLYKQNYLVGTLGLTFPDLFPKWTNDRATKLFYFGMWHLVTVYAITFSLGTLYNRGYCEQLELAMERMSAKMFGPPAALAWLLSVFTWFNEYAFAFLAISIQLFAHYENRLWEFVGSDFTPYMLVFSRCSIGRAFEQVFFPNGSDTEIIRTILATEGRPNREGKTSKLAMKE